MNLAKPVKGGGMRKNVTKKVTSTKCGMPKYGPGLAGGDKGGRHPRSEEKWKG